MKLVPVVAFALAAALAGCDRPQSPTAPAAAARFDAVASSVPAPAPLVSVALGTDAVEFWPFAGADLTGTPQDPINLVFAGTADPRAVRAALMALDGDRTAFGLPPVFPFNCTWKDAIGGVETAYATGAGWVGSAIQLECGDYGPLRFHLRLFRTGAWTLANGHFEVLIPGTTEHQVLSWELAEQLVVVDFLRSGALDPALPLFPTGPINPAPFREIPALIYNGLPVELRAAIGGPLPDQAAPVPIGSDGRATVLNVAQAAAAPAGLAVQDFTIQFDQVIPKPFCATGPGDFLYVNGPIALRQIVQVTPGGEYLSEFHAGGQLDVTPVNPLTSPPTPVGETYRAVIQELHRGMVTDQVAMAAQTQIQVEVPPLGDARGRLLVTLQVGPDGVARQGVQVQCIP